MAFYISILDTFLTPSYSYALYSDKTDYTGINMRLYDKKIIFILPMVAAMAAVSGCQPKSAAKDEQPASSASVKEQNKQKFQ